MLDFTSPLTQDQRDAARNFRIARGVQTDIIRIKKLNEFATAPSYGSTGAAGLDLSANFADAEVSAYLLKSGERKLFKTGIAISIPLGHYARVAPRSGLAFKSGIDVLAGVIDEDYRGEVGVILINLGSSDFVVSHGDRIAQLIIEQYTPCLPVIVYDLDDTNRGAGGFGSTGK